MARQRTRKSEQRLGMVRTALSEQRYDDAWAQARGLLAGRKIDAATLNLAGVAAFHAGEAETGIQLLQDAAGKISASSASFADVHMNLGNVLAAVGDTEAALNAYAAAHGNRPAYAEPAYNAGILMMGAGRYGEAADWYAKALDRDPGHGQAALGRAEALRLTGDLAGAEAALAALLAQDANKAEALTNLAAVLSAQGKDDAARAAAEQAAKLAPGLAAAHYNWGVALQALGDMAGAADRYRHTLALDPRHAASAINMGEAMLSDDDIPGAEAAYGRALEIDPNFAKAAVNLADLQLRRGETATAVAVIDKFLKQVPGDPSALAFKAIALHQQELHDQASVLDDPARFIMAHEIDPPEGYGDLVSFNRALAEHVLGHPTLVSSPRAHATRIGRHSGELLTPPFGPMAAFRDIVEAQFHTYRRRFMGEASHPFLDRVPGDIRFSIWGVVMGEEGHQVPHIHPSAWLSGVYYVEVPDALRDNDPDHTGWIEFGRPPGDIHATYEPNVSLFRPVEGTMLLFPSHFYHRTVPLKGAARRISIAFDVMPPAPAHVENP